MTRARLQPLVEMLALGTLGATLLHTVTSGQVRTLLHPILQPLVAGGGAVLLLAALFHALLSVPVPGALPSGALRPGALRKTLRNLLAALAVVAAVALAPTSFSSLATANRTTSDPTALLKKTSEEAPPLQTDASGALKVETVDLLMAAEHDQTMKEMEGRKVHLIGQFLPGDGESFKLVRFLMFCCAADAQPISVDVRTATGVVLPPIDRMGWVEISGPVHFREEVPGKHQPTVEAAEVKGIPEPSDKFLY